MFKRVEALQRHLQQRKAEGEAIGFVPTMGALHEGHLELLRRSMRENQCTVC
ncbi:MAG: pantoate--beta-alanine ligase, partial [Bacteroidetes bacterium]